MFFSTSDLLNLSERSLTFAECFDKKDFAKKNTQNSDFITSIIKHWCQLIADGNQTEFEKRLNWDGLDLNTVNTALAYSAIFCNQHLPTWATTLNECIYEYSQSYVNLKKNGNIALEDENFLYPPKRLPFEELWIPFIYVARRKLKERVGFRYDLLADTAHATLEYSLLKHLVYLSSLTIELEFSIFRASKQSTLARRLKKLTNSNNKENYQDFIESFFQGKILKLFQEYPVLARLASTSVEQWINSNEEFLNRLEFDLPIIHKTFHCQTNIGQVVAIKVDLSDRHNNGQSVMALKFESGLKLVYKPKKINLEKAYINILNWLNENGVPLSFKVFKVISCSNYGWVEFIDSLPCQNNEEASRYYLRAGMLLCLAHILGATDLHIENIITCGEHPVLIDLETLMHPRVREGIENPETIEKASDVANRLLWHSVIRTGLLPRWQFDANNQAYDSSGLGNSKNREMVIRGFKWSNINTDAMKVSYENINIKLELEISPTSQENISLDVNNYSKEITIGFEKMYNFLMKNRHKLLANDSPLQNLKNQDIRFVFRPTRVYSHILQKSLEPQFLKNGIERSIQIDIICKGILTSDVKPNFWQLLSVERQALEQMDIPLFVACSGSDDLTVCLNHTIDKYFSEPSFNLVVSRLNQLNDKDLEQQLDFIRGSLRSHTANDQHHYSYSETAIGVLDSVATLTQQQIVEQAILIAENLQKLSISSSDGSSTWIAPQYIYKTQCYQLQPLNYTLYDGLCGVSLFFSALEKVTDGLGFRKIALAALESLRQDFQGSASAKIPNIMGIGAGVGCGSIIYAFTRISQFLKEPSLLDDAKGVAMLITPEQIAADQKFDIMAGSAGAILGFLALHSTSPDFEVLAQAINCGDHLLNNRVTSDSNYRTWATSDGTLLTGFSHGAAGIAYALLRLYQATDKVAFLEAAEEAIAYENSVFIPEMENWPDFREPDNNESPSCMCSWCHGAAGIGLSRVAGLAILNTAGVLENIEVAINTTKQYGLSDRDYLCCGNLGRVEFLFTAAKKLSQRQLLETAMEQATQVVFRAKQRGFAYNPILGFHPGFFQGASGIGYQLLRLAYPDQLPSVLLWE